MAVKYDKESKTYFSRVSYKDKSTGKYKTKSKFNFKRKKDADRWEREIKDKLEKGIDVGSNPPFDIYFKKWVDTYKKPPVVRPRTYKNYITTANIVDEYFKDVRLKSIDKMQYQNFLNELGLKNARSTNKKVNTHIRACIREAIDEGIISKDFTQKAQLSGSAGQAEEEKYLSENEVKLLLSEIRSGMTDLAVTRWMALLQFAGALRFSEVSGLSYPDDFNMKDSTIIINKAWSFEENNFGPTKNEITRVIKIEPSVLMEIKSYILRRRKFFLKHGIPNPKNLAFISNTGTGYPPTHAAMNKMLRKACERAEVPKITSHGLRHTHVALLIYRGMDIKSISKRIGHSTPITTLEEYSHVISELENRNDEISDKMVSEVI